MKIAIVNSWGAGAVHNVMKPMADYLGADYISIVDDIDNNDNFDLSFDDYDLVHFGYFASAARFCNSIEVPFTCTVHHMLPNRVTKNIDALERMFTSAIVTPDIFCQRQLGQLGINGSHLIPYSFDHSVYNKKVEECSTWLNGDFKVSYLGCDSDVKRFKIIEEACAQMGVECVGIDRGTKDEQIGFKPQDEILDMYLDSSVFVCASWNEGGPLPPQEALLLGRPVVTTPVGMMPDLIVPGVNGEFFDGTVSDLIVKLAKVRECLLPYHYGALNTKLPTIQSTSESYLKVFERVLKDAL